MLGLIKDNRGCTGWARRVKMEGIEEMPPDKDVSSSRSGAIVVVTNKGAE